MRFSEIYRNNKPVFSLELFPPRDEGGLPAMYALVDRLALELRPDFFTVTYGAAGGTRAFTQALASHIAGTHPLPAAAHLTSIGHSKHEIDALLDKYEAEGIRHVVALRGDAKTNPPPASHFACARDLVRHIGASRRFSIAVAGYPEKHPDAPSVEADLEYLKEKVEAGADVVFTQLFFEPDVYFRFVERARKIGIRVPIVPGVMPISNTKQVRKFTTLCGASIPAAIQAKLDELGDDERGVKEFGADWASKQCAALLANGAPGIHFYTLNRLEQVEAVIRTLRMK